MLAELSLPLSVKGSEFVERILLPSSSLSIVLLNSDANELANNCLANISF